MHSFFHYAAFRTGRTSFALAAAWLLMAAASVQGQNFINLNFESAGIYFHQSPGAQPGSLVPVSSAFPGWSSTTLVAYDGLSLGGAFISIIDTNVGAGFEPLQGQYSALLFGGEGSPTTLSQTGLVPAGSESLRVALAGSGISLLIVSLGGQTIQMAPVATFANFTEYGGNISSFAGQVETLSFTEQPPSGVPPSFLELDNIIFSTLPVPEPATCALILAGAVLFGFCRSRKSQP